MRSAFRAPCFPPTYARRGTLSLSHAIALSLSSALSLDFRFSLSVSLITLPQINKLLLIDYYKLLYIYFLTQTADFFQYVRITCYVLS